MAKNQVANVPAHLRERAQQLTAAGVAWEIKYFVRNEVSYVTIAHDVAEARVKGVGACVALTETLSPVRVRLADGVEVYDLPDFTRFGREHWRVHGHYGSPAKVCKLAGIPLERISTSSARGKSKSGGGQGSRWQVCFLPSGNLYIQTWREGKEGAKEKEEDELALITRVQSGEHLPIQRTDWRECDWRAGVRWYGHRDDLIEACVCPEHHLSSARPRASGDEANAEPAQRRPGIDEWKARKLCEGFYEYWVEYTHDEATRLARLQEKKAPLFSDLDEFADSCERVLRVDVKCTIASLSGAIEKELRGKVSCRYLPEDVAKVKAALEHALQLLQSCTPVVVRPTLTPKSPAPSAVAKAKHDEAFRAFLSKLPTAPLG